MPQAASPVLPVAATAMSTSFWSKCAAAIEANTHIDRCHPDRWDYSCRLWNDTRGVAFLQTTARLNVRQPVSSIIEGGRSCVSNVANADHAIRYYIAWRLCWAVCSALWTTAGPSVFTIADGGVAGYTAGGIQPYQNAAVFQRAAGRATGLTGCHAINAGHTRAGEQWSPTYLPSSAGGCCSHRSRGCCGCHGDARVAAASGHCGVRKSSAHPVFSALDGLPIFARTSGAGRRTPRNSASRSLTVFPPVGVPRTVLLLPEPCLRTCAGNVQCSPVQASFRVVVLT